jgi:hypothetical protein
MCMYKGEPISGPDFFRLLYADDKFCAELGRAVLAAGRLESLLKRHIAKHASETDTSRATLGRLIEFARKHMLLQKMLPALEVLRDQRNYLTHNIHALLSGLVEETILEGSGLLDSDIHTYTERAWQLKENLNDLADIIDRKDT